MRSDDYASYTNLLFRFDEGMSASTRILVGTVTVDSVLAAWRKKNEYSFLLKAQYVIQM